MMLTVFILQIILTMLVFFGITYLGLRSIHDRKTIRELSKEVSELQKFRAKVTNVFIERLDIGAEVFSLETEYDTAPIQNTYGDWRDSAVTDVKDIERTRVNEVHSK